MKKLFAVTTILLVIISYTSFIPTLANTAIFPDVDYYHEFYDSINYVQTNGIVNGYSDGTYKPDKTITRSEFTKILISTLYPSEDAIFTASKESKCAIGPDDYGYIYKGSFPDIDDYSKFIITSTHQCLEENCEVGQTYEEGNLFAKYICIAKNQNIIGGFSDGTFRPDEEIQFGPASKILAKSLGLNPDLSLISDEDKFKPYIMVLADRKAIPLSINHRDKKVTRGELSEIIYRIKTGTQKDSKTYNDFIPSQVQGIAATVSTPVSTYESTITTTDTFNVKIIETTFSNANIARYIINDSDEFREVYNYKEADMILVVVRSSLYHPLFLSYNSIKELENSSNLQLNFSGPKYHIYLYTINNDLSVAQIYHDYFEEEENTYTSYNMFDYSYDTSYDYLPISTPTTNYSYSNSYSYNYPTYIPISTPTPYSNSYSCNCSKTCTQMNSCSEAYHQLTACGCYERDGDNDGVPCENLCG